MIYGSVCSGIEAATVAWKPLGWTASFFSEIDAFPRAVLAHRFPDVPLHGDFTTIQRGDYGAIDLLVGGTPCQSFSVAGLRGGLDDQRGNLALEYLKLAGRLRPRWLVWENVPGVLSQNGGRDFGAILGGMVELGYGWAYRILDAQHAGVPQRRRRVFVVGYFGDWRPAAAVLFERHSLSWHSAPRREAREAVAPTFRARSQNGGGLGCDFEIDGGLVAPTLSSRPTAGGGMGTDFDLDGGLIANGPNGVDVSHAVTSKDHARYDPNGETYVAYDVTGVLATNGAHPTDTHTSLRARAPGRSEASTTTVIAHSLRADGFDASEDGTGRGIPLVTHTLNTLDGGGYVTEDGTGRGVPVIPILEVGKGSSSRGEGPNGAGFGADGDPMFTLQAGAQHAVAVAIRTRDDVPTLEVGDDKANAILTPDGGRGGTGVGAVWVPDVADPLMDNEARTYSNAGNNPRLRNCVTTLTFRRQAWWRDREAAQRRGQLAHAFAQNQRGEVREMDVSSSLNQAGGKPGTGYPAAMQAGAVRRLTPRECERLQGFPDDFTLVPYRSKPAADGPRYKSLGNSMAIPVVRWIGERIAMVEEKLNGVPVSKVREDTRHD